MIQRGTGNENDRDIATLLGQETTDLELRQANLLEFTYPGPRHPVVSGGSGSRPFFEPSPVMMTMTFFGDTGSDDGQP